MYIIKNDKEIIIYTMQYHKNMMMSQNVAIWEERAKMHLLFIILLQSQPIITQIPLLLIYMTGPTITSDNALKYDDLVIT